MAIPDPKPREALPLSVPLIVSQKRENPVIELRRCISDLATIKLLISAAFHKRPLVIVPTFTNEIKSLSTLLDKGLIYWDKEKKQYFFNF